MMQDDRFIDWFDDQYDRLKADYIAKFSPESWGTTEEQELTDFAYDRWINRGPDDDQMEDR